MPFQKGNRHGRANGKSVTVELNAAAVRTMTAREKILDVIKEPGFIQIIQRMFAQARKGSFKHQELLLYYILGKPTDHLHIEGDKMPLMQYSPVVKIIADTLRLEKLEKDRQTTGDVPQSTIDEAEGILNKAVEERVAEVEAEATARTNGKATLQHRNGKIKPRKK